MAYDLRPGPAPQIAPESFTRRRAAVAKTLGRGKCLLVATHTEALFANDVHHRFRPHSDFWYLTGLNEPGAVLLIQGGTGRTTLWLHDREPQHEIWNGRRLGLARAKEQMEIDVVHDIEKLATTVTRAVGKSQVHEILAHDAGTRRKIRKALDGKFQDGAPIVALHRVRKDAEELRLMRRACAIGMEAMEIAAQQIVPGNTEHALEAALLHHYRLMGSEGPGYPPIVGAGANASILHYIRNQDKIRAKDLVLIDAGCSWGYYTSDITRTFPAKQFTPTQAAIYDVVHRARDAAVKAVKPGNAFRAPHDAACSVLTEGLVELGYLEGDPKSLTEMGAFRPWFMHGTSHFLGLDVHDAGRYRDDDGKPAKLEEGMVLTVEPGLYFNPDYATCPKGTAGIGIRIEDDVAVTSSGRSVLTSKLPVDRDAVAAMVQG